MALVDGVLSLYVYIGLYMNKEVVRLDSRTGKIVKRFSVAPTAPYGLVLDKGGNVWVLGLESGGPSLTRIDVRGGDKVTTYSAANGKAPPCGYGITADARGLVYTTGSNCIARFNPTNENWEQFNVPGASSLRGVAIGRKNYLHVGSDAGGHTAAVMYTLLVTAKLNGINPQRYLRYVLERIADHPICRIDELLPWRLAKAKPQLLRDPGQASDG